MVRDTLPSQDASTHQIWNSYLKEYRRYGPDTKAGRTDGLTDGRTVRLLYASQSSFGGIKTYLHVKLDWDLHYFHIFVKLLNLKENKEIMDLLQNILIIHEVITVHSVYVQIPKVGPENFFLVINIFHRGPYSLTSLKKNWTQVFLMKHIATCDFQGWGGGSRPLSPPTPSGSVLAVPTMKPGIMVCLGSMGAR